MFLRTIQSDPACSSTGLSYESESRSVFFRSRNPTWAIVPSWPRVCGNRPTAARSRIDWAPRLALLRVDDAEWIGVVWSLDLCLHEFDQRLRAKDLDCPL